MFASMRSPATLRRPVAVAESLPDADRPEPREPFANTMRICRPFRVRVNLNPEHAFPQDTQRHGVHDLLQCTKDEEMVRGVQQHSGDSARYVCYDKLTLVHFQNSVSITEFQDRAS
jgi:hypothetical protein